MLLQLCYKDRYVQSQSAKWFHGQQRSKVSPHSLIFHVSWSLMKEMCHSVIKAKTKQFNGAASPVFVNTLFDSSNAEPVDWAYCGCLNNNYNLMMAVQRYSTMLGVYPRWLQVQFGMIFSSNIRSYHSSMCYLVLFHKQYEYQWNINVNLSIFVF